MNDKINLTVKSYGMVNWIGLWTLYQKEVKRFMTVYLQTLIAPMITTLLFFAIFALALGGAVRTVWDIPFMQFLAPGILMMSMVQNAFSNTSSSLVISKVQGNIVDILMPPMASWELVTAWVAGSVSRGLLIGMIGGLALHVFYPITIASLGWVIAFALAGTILLSLLGIIAGVWADKFDHIAAVSNFVITPLTFLSGTFYSIDILPGIWVKIAHYNPFFYMIDGFRFGFLGQSDSDPLTGIVVLIVVNAVLLFGLLLMLEKGYKIKS